ncbi:MAG TPA: DUF1638 domain-containing protein [Phycisphaerae bacterium]|nr:DUF1638 domain-containing protein [Phycisphaerae bacterium]
MSDEKQRRLKFIGCEILYREACYLAATTPHIVDLEFLRKGLHDLETADMVAKVQAAVDAVDPADGYEAVLLGYARCNDGLVGVEARQIPLVIPRAHDCITFFMGSRQAYREYFDRCPGTYYMTSGWVERNQFEQGDYAQPAYGRQGVMGKLGLTDSYEQLVAKYGEENAQYIAETLGDWTKNYDKYLYLEMGVCDERRFIEQTREQAKQRNWRFELRKGDWTLLRKLFEGRWDEDFVVLQPGRKLLARNDERVLDADDQ